MAGCGGTLVGGSKTNFYPNCLSFCDNNKIIAILSVDLSSRFYCDFIAWTLDSTEEKGQGGGVASLFWKSADIFSSLVAPSSHLAKHLM